MVDEEEWVQYIPDEGPVSISIDDTEEKRTIAEVKIRFNNLGYRVKDWGEVSRKDGVIYVNAEIERYNGPAGQAIKTADNSYSLGDLKKGEYEFLFKVWNENVASVQFSVP